jgi:hypothetical protein
MVSDAAAQAGLAAALHQETMSSISHIQQIVTVIRQEMTARGAVPFVQANMRVVRSKTARSREGALSDKGKLFTLIGRRIQSIDKADPDRGQKAFRIFLESVLLAEFGEALINDSAFYRMVEDIQLQMEADPLIAVSIRSAIAVLLTHVAGSVEA